MNIIDFESYSPVPIDAGSVKYAAHPDADIVLCAYKFGDMKTKAWTPGAPHPPEFYDKDIVVHAHKALFDYIIWHLIGVQKYNFPEIPIWNWRCTMGLANRYTLPGALAKAGAILNVPVQKSPRGKALIKKICIPTAAGNRPVPGKDFTYNEAEEFIQYGIDDVESTFYMVKGLPADELSADEQRYWELTQKMNMNGLPIDWETADKILSYIDSYAEEMTRRVPEISEGAVEKVTQIQRVKAWMKTRHGITVKDLAAGTVEKLLKGKLPPEVREMLELRQMLGRSSTAKYRKIQLMEHEGRVFDNLLYHGAAPGRWTGASFQLHNLPRASVPDPEAVIDKFNNFEPIDDPVNVAKALIRPMIYSGPSSSLVVSDYKAIETCNLFWLAGDHETCDAIRQGKDLYVEMAAYMYQIRPDQVTKRQRQIGKIIILGCGYQMGAKRFKDTCAQWGIEISMSEALAAVEAYRAKYPLVKRMWKMLALAAKNAIQYPGNRYDYRDCSFRMVRDRAGNRWLLITLPSGRNMFYMEPYLEEDEWGMVPGHYGINPYTKKWSRRRLIPGRIIENIDQGLARDIMAIGLVNIDDNMPQINLIGTVHDEAIGEIEDRFIHEGLLAEFNNNLCRMPEWANGLPLSAEGYIAKRYRK